jgi:quercetin dioxygenase-like cupin family protein
MENIELEKSIVHILNGIIEYISKSVVSKAIIRKTTGNIRIVASDKGEVAENISPFDKFIQIIEGVAEVVIDDKTNKLRTGQGIIIPEHTLHIVKANERFKMISTVIKSGYDGILL